MSDTPKRYAVAVASPSSGEKVWVSPLGRLVHEGWRAATFTNIGRANELAARRPKWESVEITEAPDTRPPSAEAVTTVTTAEPPPTSRASDWAGTNTPGVQQRTRADGSTVYRARSQGKVSPTFTTLEEAREWRP
jgi:hypothetical protein